MRLIDADALLEELNNLEPRCANKYVKQGIDDGLHYYMPKILEEQPTIDAVPVVRCQNCIHAEPLDRNCELNGSLYMHCKMWRGEEETNVWHKYKRYYKDYSLVERDGFCSGGARMDGE